MKDYSIVFNPELIFDNLLRGFLSKYTSYLKANNIENEFWNSELNGDVFLTWLTDAFAFYKNLVCSEKRNKQVLKIDRDILRGFPFETFIFFLKKADQFSIFSCDKDNLYISGVESQGIHAILTKKSFFENFCQPNRQIKFLENMIYENSYRLENIFANSPSTETKQQIEKLTKNLNDEFPEILDFLIFCLKYLSYTPCEECYKIFNEYLIDGIVRKNVFPNSINENHKKEFAIKKELFFNKLNDIDRSLSHKIFGELLFFSNQILYFDFPYQVQWKKIFGEHHYPAQSHVLISMNQFL
jgi:hypothetical protein